MWHRPVFAMIKYKADKQAVKRSKNTQRYNYPSLWVRRSIDYKYIVSEDLPAWELKPQNIYMHKLSIVIKNTCSISKQVWRCKANKTVVILEGFRHKERCRNMTHSQWGGYKTQSIRKKKTHAHIQQLYSRAAIHSVSFKLNSPCICGFILEGDNTHLCLQWGSSLSRKYRISVWQQQVLLHLEWALETAGMHSTREIVSLKIFDIDGFVCSWKTQEKTTIIGIL